MSIVDLGGLRQTARRQRGLFTRDQAYRHGITAAQIRHRITTGQWRRVLGRVLAPADLPLSPLVLDRAAALAVPGAVLAGPSAARVWRIAVPDQRRCLAVDPGRHPHVPGIRYLRCGLDPREIAQWEGAPVTSPRRTVLDCLLLLPEAAARDLLDRALNQGHLTVPHLSAFVQSYVGRRGVRRLVRLLHGVSTGSRSAAERLSLSLLTAAGIGGWQANAPIYDDRGLIGYGDIVFPAARLVIEIDGWAYHSSSGQFQRDRTRQNRLVAAGWRVLRFTWQDLTERPNDVIAGIRRMLATT